MLQLNARHTVYVPDMPVPNRTISSLDDAIELYFDEELVDGITSLIRLRLMK